MFEKHLVYYFSSIFTVGFIKSVSSHVYHHYVMEVVYVTNLGYRNKAVETSKTNAKITPFAVRIHLHVVKE